MDAPTLPLISSFIIRFVLDETADQPTYHGVVRHIQTAQEVSFTEWREATEFMRRFVQLDELQPPSSPDPITNL
ncbi:MAG: hypothetical protein FJ031_02060 [Chloroflexi bacterium]|nr:hypothetical protein [Chloroflexota bacterium]